MDGQTDVWINEYGVALWHLKDHVYAEQDSSGSNKIKKGCELPIKWNLAHIYVFQQSCMPNITFWSSD